VSEFDVMSERAEAFKRKALQYERAASMATDPDACHAYLDLARQLRARAEQAEAFARVTNLRQGIWWPTPVRGDDDKNGEGDVTA
jgi:hypothetical protein